MKNRRFLNLSLSLSFIALVGVSAGCSDDDNLSEPKDFPEVSSLEITMEPNDVGNNLFFKADDTVVVETDTLFDNTTYDVTSEFFSDIRSLNELIADEATEFQVFYFFDTSLALSFNYTDSDVNGNPVGLQGQLIADSASQGQMSVLLIADLEKDAPGVFEGDTANAGGDIRYSATFDLLIR